ncbi:unnamed protein product [Vicia faba]|uniref:Cotton fiber protein n=1 Tax=Vicia faba TaxID=3906 RepID=A0AAV0ZTQ8_VICFA|nr:unnamed protein product [Vicia faba]
MSRLKLSKKLKPAKKAWKNLSNNFQSKLHKLNIQKAFKTTLQRLLSLFHSITHLITSKTTHHRSLTSSKSLYSPSTSYYHFQHKNFPAIPIYNKPSSSSSISSSIRHAQGNTSREIEEVHGDDDNKTNEMNTIEDAWKAVVAKSPMMHVDQKAEEFIYKFREDIRLQKEKSLLEFHERLARST